MLAKKKNKPDRSYHNNDLSFPCSKKHNNYIVFIGLTVFKGGATIKQKEKRNMQI